MRGNRRQIGKERYQSRRPQIIGTIVAFQQERGDRGRNRISDNSSLNNSMV